MTAFATQRAEICRVGRSLFDRGYVHASAGNISMRLPDEHGFLITPTDACLGALRPDQLAHVNAGGAPLAGLSASKTLALHRGIYAAEPDVHCVLHTHSTQLVALTLEGVWHADAVLPPITPYFVMKVGRVPLIAYHRPGDPAVAGLVAAAMAAGRARHAPIRAVLLERLGPVVWHESPAAAMALLEELEETGRLGRTPDPKPAPLAAAQIDELRGAFGARW